MECSCSENFWKAFCERGLIRASCADIAKRGDPAAWSRTEKPFYLKEMAKEADSDGNVEKPAQSVAKEADSDGTGAFENTEAPAAESLGNIFETPEKTTASAPNGGGGALSALGELK